MKKSVFNKANWGEVTRYYRDRDKNIPCLLSFDKVVTKAKDLLASQDK